MGWAEARLSKKREWMDGVDIPETVMTTRAPPVLKIRKMPKTYIYVLTFSFQNHMCSFFMINQVRLYDRFELALITIV